MAAAPTEEMLALIAEKFRLLGDPSRLAILHCLMEEGELNVSQVVKLSGRSTANVSKHLKMLADASLVARRKEGPFVLYRLDDPVLTRICELACDSLRRELAVELSRNKRLLRKRHS